MITTDQNDDSKEETMFTPPTRIATMLLSRYKAEKDMEKSKKEVTSERICWRLSFM